MHREKGEGQMAVMQQGCLEWQLHPMRYHPNTANRYEGHDSSNDSYWSNKPPPRRSKRPASINVWVLMLRMDMRMFGWRADFAIEVGAKEGTPL